MLDLICTLTTEKGGNRNMGTKADLVMGVDVFTRLDLLRQATAYKGLKLKEGVSKAYSEPIKAYILDDKLLAILAERGIKRQDRPDCQNRIFTLVDENPQKDVPGYAPSDYWNFELLEGDGRKLDLSVSLSVGFNLNIEKRGIVFWPQAHGSFVSAADRLPNFRMFKALVENDDEAPAVAKELAASDGSIVVSWTDLGFGGIRSLADLFAEFAGRNDTIVQLGRDQKVFDPVPNLRYQQPGDELFVVEPAQPRVIQTWREQLNEYRACLVA